MDTAAQWPQNIMMKVPMEEMPNQNQNHQNNNNNNNNNQCNSLLSASSSVERKLVRPHKEQALNCPRCNSTNTKFCYYNNYSLSQPRYFCKTCRRYWTDGGSLRSIPVGGGSRKNKRPSSSSSSTYHNNNTNNNPINNNNNNSSSTSTSSNSSSKKLPDLVPPHHQNPKTHFLESQDLNLGFSIHHPNNNNNNNNHGADADFKAITEMIQAPNFENIPSFGGGIRTATTTTTMTTTLGLQNPNSLGGFNNYAFMPLPVVNATTSPVFGSGFPNLAEYNNNNNHNNNNNKSSSSLNFSLDYGSYRDNNGDSGSKLLFPFEDLKQDHHDQEASNSANVNDGDHHPSNGYWNGVIGGGGGSW